MSNESVPASLEACSERAFRTMRRLLDLRQPVIRTVGPAAVLSDAARLMTEHRIDAVIVLDGEVLVGVLSARNVAAASALHPDTAPRDLRVTAAMDVTALHAGPGTTVPEALALLADQSCDHLPVIAEGRVVDLISRADLLRELVWHYTEVIREMRLQQRIMHLQGVYSC